MDRTRFDFLKGVAGYFKTTPNATQYLGVSKANCFSLLNLSVSAPGEILDSTHPEFLEKTEEKLNQFSEALQKNEALPENLRLPEELENVTQEWQDKIAQEKDPVQQGVAGRELDGKIKSASLKAWGKANPELESGITRLQLFKKVSTYFRENPKVTHHLGVSKQTCSSVIALHLSTPEELVDPTAPDFWAKADEKINQSEEKILQNQPLPQTIALPKNMEDAVQKWQDSVMKEGASPLLKKEKKDIKTGSLNIWKRINPKLASKVEWFLKSPLTKVGSVVGFALLATLFSAEIIKKAVKYLGAPLYFLYNIFAALGTGAIVGFAVGAVTGGIAGGVAGAILGAKLGAAIGLAVGGPIGAVIGGVLGGIVGFVVGLGVGALIGGAVLGTLGYAIEHWVWQPVQSLWVGAGNALGGVGGFFGGLFGGLGSAIGGALSATGGAAMATGNFLSGLVGQLSTISLPTTVVTVPLLGATGVAFGFTFWANTSIVGTAFMRQPAPQTTPPPVVSEYISLSKDGVFPGIGAPISYSLTLTAKNKRLENIQIIDETTFNCAGAPPSVPRKTLGPIVFIDPNQTSTLNYSTDTNPQFNNCTVTNTATATFDVREDGKTGQTAPASFSVTIGSPPAPSCPIPSGVITCGSYTAGCHCRPGYILYPCTNNPTAPFAIDVAGPSRGPNYDVYLPAVKGVAQWQLTKEGEVRDGPPYYYYWGWERIFFGTSNGINYTIRFLHIINSPPLEINNKWYPVGTRVGRLWDGTGWNGPGEWGPHVHVTVSEGGTFKDADYYFNLCGG